MIWLVCALGVVLLAFFAFCGFKQTCRGVYFVLKAAVFKSLEYFLRSLVAVWNISIYFWTGFFLITLFIEVYVSSPVSKLVWFGFIIIYGGLFVYKFVYNFRDEDDRDFVRMTLAQLEHKLCFNNKKLSLYPDDYHWED